MLVDWNILILLQEEIDVLWKLLIILIAVSVLPVSLI